MKPETKKRIISIFRHYEQAIVLILLALLMVVILYATVAFVAMIAITMVKAVRSTEFHITLPLLHEVFAGFLMLLIGLELMKTIVMYLDEHVIHVEVVLEVAIIAIARHAIDMDFNKQPPLGMIGIGAIMIALVAGYYYFRKAELLASRKDAPQSKEH